MSLRILSRGKGLSVRSILNSGVMSLRVFTAFSGYDSQCMALDKLGIDYELVGWLVGRRLISTRFRRIMLSIRSGLSENNGGY